MASCFLYSWQPLIPDLDSIESFGSFSVLSKPWGIRIATQSYSELVCMNQLTYPWIHLPKHLPQLLPLYTQVVWEMQNSFSRLANSWLHSGKFKHNLLCCGNSRPTLSFYYKIFPHSTTPIK